MVQRTWFLLLVVLVLVSPCLAGCRGGSVETVSVAGDPLTTEVALEPEAVVASATSTPAGAATVAETVATPSVTPTALADDQEAVPGLPLTLRLPAGWAQRQIAEGVIIAEDEASLAAPELECAALLIRRVEEAATPEEVLATYDLSAAVRQREVPLVIARNPVDAIDATLVSSDTGRVYQVVLAPLVIKGEALLFIASMPEGQADQAWPLLATMLGSVDFVTD